MATNNDVAESPEVLLVFPPLVESSFGSFYPSTAVLAAWLSKHGIAAAQRDLNTEFAEYLITEACLARLGAGEVPGVRYESLVASCARWARRERTRLTDTDGVRLFGRATQVGYVVEELAHPFVIDPDDEALASITSLRRAAHPLDTHAAFLEWAECDNAIPASVRLVGVSVPMGPQLVPALLLAQTLKAARPDVRVVLGGPALSLMDIPALDELLANHRAVDAVVRFDGEYPLLALAKQVRTGEWDPARTPGTSALRDGVAQHRPPTAGPALNTLPAPEYPPAAIARLAVPKLSVTQARGCYWGKCDYCDFVELYDGSPPYRGRRADAVLADFEQLMSRYGTREFTLITESIPPAFARRLSQLIIDRDLGITWDSFAMVDRRFDRELLELMVKAGCRYLVIGMETMTTRVLELVHKSSDREENQRFLREAREAGMKLSVNLIPDLPSTTYQEALRSLSDIADMVDCLDSVSIFPFEPTRSSNIGRSPARFGLIPVLDTSADSQAQYTLNHMSSVDPAMTSEERVDVHARFRAFARSVNLPAKIRAGGTKRRPVGDHIGFGTTIRLAVEDLDLIEVGGEIVCTHIIGQERIVIPEAAANVLRPYLGGQQFSVGGLVQQIGSSAAEALLSNLVEAQIVTECSGTPSDADPTRKLSLSDVFSAE
ncbi:B12-binding domain-containing radical SAM protein [Streptomyces sp. 8L]|uniref:B12-binding domain-containing radical SAM protein n=1 Tax=Streptomyces sp. 8L TaxID=2877242 RepID=UPI001CD5916E|nr:radical SAM protein [Streptomyces sp. 8L]MCA1217112.1 radical SAM protein [Streptomyces sp. 8L]